MVKKRVCFRCLKEERCLRRRNSGLIQGRRVRYALSEAQKRRSGRPWWGDFDEQSSGLEAAPTLIAGLLFGRNNNSWGWILRPDECQTQTGCGHGKPSSLCIFVGRQRESHNPRYSKDAGVLCVQRPNVWRAVWLSGCRLTFPARVCPLADFSPMEVAGAVSSIHGGLA